MYTVYTTTKNATNSRVMNTLWAANLVAKDMVSRYGWDEALVIDNDTGEVLREHRKG